MVKCKVFSFHWIVVYGRWYCYFVQKKRLRIAFWPLKCFMNLSQHATLSISESYGMCIMLYIKWAYTVAHCSDFLFILIWHVLQECMAETRCNASRGSNGKVYWDYYRLVPHLGCWFIFCKMILSLFLFSNIVYRLLLFLEVAKVAGWIGG